MLDEQLPIEAYIKEGTETVAKLKLGTWFAGWTRERRETTVNGRRTTKWYTSKKMCSCGERLTLEHFLECPAHEGSRNEVDATLGTPMTDIVTRAMEVDW